jgi:hypothetical protein
MSTLKASIEALANQFATGVLAAIRGSSLEDTPITRTAQHTGRGLRPRLAVVPCLARGRG